MSRDWVIDKFTISVGYDTDINKVRKMVKGVGAALLEDEEYGSMILETLKMKGVEQFGDYGINLSFAMMTKPGYQTTIRRKAYMMIREAFTTNGIVFASPTVQVRQQRPVGSGSRGCDREGGDGSEKAGRKRGGCLMAGAIPRKGGAMSSAFV